MSVKTDVELQQGQLRLGEISGLHGVKGWVKVFSDTQPRENIFSYQPWQLHGPAGQFSVEVSHWRKQGKTLVAHISGLSDREQARELIGAVISVPQSVLPELDQGEFYWSELIGLRVKTTDAKRDEVLDLGVVAELIETGANDVLVVRGDDESIDQAERLIPWLCEQVIKDVDLATGDINVDWDPEF